MKTEIMEVCNQEMEKKEGKNKGFSLVELIVVIAIMAILAIVIAPQVMKYIGQSRSSVDETNKSAYKTAVNTALANEKAYSEVATKSGVTITITSTDITYSPAVATFATEFESIISIGRKADNSLLSTPALPKENDMNAFEISIAVNTTEKTVGAVTVKAIKHTPATP